MITGPTFPPPWKRGDKLHAEALNRLRTHVVRNSRMGAHNGHAAASNGTGLYPRVQPVQMYIFPAVILDSRPWPNRPNRFQYAMGEVFAYDAANEVLELDPKGRSSTIPVFPPPTVDVFGHFAMNGIEHGNDGQGIEHVGYDFDQDPLASSDFEIQPIQNNVVVWMLDLHGGAHPAGVSSLPQYLFCLPNAIDGECGEAGGGAAAAAGGAFNGVTSPLTISGELLGLRIGLGLRVDGAGQLAVSLNPATMKYTASGQITPRLSSGLGVGASGLVVQTGNGIEFDAAGGVASTTEFCEAYDSAGGQTLSPLGTPIDVNLGTTAVNTNITTFSVGANYIQVAEDGHYRCSARACLEGSGSAAVRWKANLRVNSSDVAGTDAHGYMARTTSERSTLSITRVLSLSAGDQVKLRCMQVGGSVSPAMAADASALGLEGPIRP